MLNESGSGEPRSARKLAPRGKPAAPRRQSLLRSQARYALLPAATPRVRAAAHRTAARPKTLLPMRQEGTLRQTCAAPDLAPDHLSVTDAITRCHREARARGVAAGRSA